MGCVGTPTLWHACLPYLVAMQQGVPCWRPGTNRQCHRMGLSDGYGQRRER